MSENNSTINELLNRDPMSLSEKDLDQLIAHFRAEREKWQRKQATPARTKKKVDLSDLDLSDLGF